MANMFTSGNSFFVLRRELEETFDEIELPWRVRQEMSRLFVESTSPMMLWRGMEHLLEDFGAPFVLRRRIENVFARFFSTLNQGTHFAPQFVGSQFAPQFASSQFAPQFVSSQFANSHFTPSYFTTGFGSHLTPGFGTPSFLGTQFMPNHVSQNPWFGETSVFANRFSPRYTDGFNRGRFNSSTFGPHNNTTFGPTWGSTTWGNAFGPFNTNNTTWGQTALGNGVNPSFTNTWGWGNSFAPFNTNNTWGNSFGLHGSTLNPMWGNNPMSNMYGNSFNSFGNTYGNTYGAFGNSFGGNTVNQNAFGQFGQDFVPPVELIERDGELIVRIELAGVREQDVEIRANEQMLMIRGERRERFDNEVARHVGSYEYSERRYGTFSRIVTLPQGIDAAHIHAVFRDGVLELRIPQAETFRQRRIPIGRLDERAVNDGQGMHPRPHVS